MYYKVLLDGKSFHGGEFEWSLPKNGKPGKWHSVTGELMMCLHGLHLTDNPQKWWDRNAKCYEVEYKDALEPAEDKICVRKVRLVRELTHDDLAKLQIFYSGEHVVKSGTALAYDSSSVTAYNSSSVKAYDSSSVKAYGSSSVTACNSSSVTACNSSSVTAYSSSSVTAYNSSSVTAYDSSSVTAYDSSSVTAYSSSSVTAYNSSSVKAYNSSSVTAYNSSSVTAYNSSSVKAYDSSSVKAYDSSTVNSRFHAGNVTVIHNAIHINRDTTPATIRGNYQGGK